MKRLQKISIFNMPCPGREIIIPFKDECNILILTGYNGVGKSRVLGALVEILALAKDVNYTDGSENWLMQLEFDEGHIFRGVKVDSDGRPKKKGYEEKIEQVLKTEDLLNAMYPKIIKAFISTRDTATYSSKSSDDESGAFCALYLKNPTNSKPKEFLKEVKVVGYINEKVVFGVKRPESDAIFDKNVVEGDLNKTLYILIKEFISTQAVKAGVEDDINKYVSEFLASANKNTFSKSDLGAVKKFVTEKMRNRQVVEEDSSIFSQHEMFIEINKIFALTSRNLTYTEGSLNIELKNGKIIPWPSLSRGEKTLLALFLLVFLNRSGALFVLDEPDLSLHMEWQKMILPGLIALAPNCQFIVATHSPFLVMNTGSEQIVNMAKLVMEAT